MSLLGILNKILDSEFRVVLSFRTYLLFNCEKLFNCVIISVFYSRTV